MFLLTGYEYFLGFLLIAAAVPILALVTNLIVAPKGRTGERKLTYESGMEPIGGAWIQFNIRYYMFALVFVIFDVETVLEQLRQLEGNLKSIHSQLIKTS